ncbi:major histocompatibility complex, class II, DO alpha, partial [Homo sapiens]
MALRAGLVLGFHTLMTLLSPQEAGATKGRAGRHRRNQSPSGHPGGALQPQQSHQRASTGDRAPQVSGGAGPAQHPHLHRGQHLPPC